MSWGFRRKVSNQLRVSAELKRAAMTSDARRVKVVMRNTPRECDLIQTAFWRRVEIRILDPKTTHCVSKQ